MNILLLFLILLSCKFEAVGAQLNLFPATLTVLRGDEARFTCGATTSEWTVMVWLLNSRAELTISKEHGVLPSINPNVTAEKSPTSQGDSWVLVLKSTEKHNEGEVTCDLLGIAAKTAKLFVQEKGSVNIFGSDKLAFKGQSVLFECAAAGWFPQPLLQWLVNGKRMNEAEYNISSEESENLFTVTSNLTVTAVVSARVDCLAYVSALRKPVNCSTRLTVVAEVLQEEDDCIVPLALAASLSALLLLVLMCICTVLCYTQRRQSKASPQEELRFEPSVFGISSGALVAGGKVNQGYSHEGMTDAAYKDTSVETQSQLDFFAFHKSLMLQVPDVVSSSSQSLHNEAQIQLGAAEESPRTVRRITTV